MGPQDQSGRGRRGEGEREKGAEGGREGSGVCGEEQGPAVHRLVHLELAQCKFTSIGIDSMMTKLQSEFGLHHIGSV